MRWHSDRVYTDTATFVKEAVRNIRSSSACDIVLNADDKLYTLYPTARGAISTTVQVQCDGAPIAEISINRHNRQVELVSITTNTTQQDGLINLVVIQLTELYADLRN